MTQPKTRLFRSNKLWRDKTPARIAPEGAKVYSRKLDDAEFNLQLRNKLLEEAEEVHTAQTRQELISEIADVFEVIDTLAQLHGITKDEIYAFQAQKREERGGFEGRLFVEKSEHPVGSRGERYCLANPKKYPEILE